MFRVGDRVRMAAWLRGSSDPRGTVVGFVKDDDVLVRWDVGMKAALGPRSLVSDETESDAA
jgi:hypothetical protein